MGKPHDGNLKNAIDDFTNRITKYFSAEWKIIPTPKNTAALNEVELKKAEAIIIAQQLNKDDYLILLDETGKQLSSIELANFIQQRANESSKRIIFLIGGAYGVDETIKQKANFVFSFSKLVFPHQIFRLMLAEQVYRACTILRNEKYHHI